jgi:hypothetical protein
MGFSSSSGCNQLSIREDETMSVREIVRNQNFNTTLIACCRETSPFLSESFAIAAAFALLPIIEISAVVIISMFDDVLGRSVVDFLNAAALADPF